MSLSTAEGDQPGTVCSSGSSSFSRACDESTALPSAAASPP
eukprot:CAMPEP_0172744220 /NCGR_PEP_ID=MMETSP1074-20121228/134616_1 /TAXON_ID=2916 /ORGANISM="Ceratium fusus, Strain PA161109" /LENGTH=40 /DNA_ID= /DNA_START= /DNA_END= /DNA_ORIENTATION=